MRIAAHQGGPAFGAGEDGGGNPGQEKINAQDRGKEQEGFPGGLAGGVREAHQVLQADDRDERGGFHQHLPDIGIARQREADEQAAAVTQ